MKTSELTGPALDWAVAKCAEYEVEISNSGRVVFDTYQDDPPPFVNEYDDSKWQQYAPSINWSQGGPIIEREGINIVTIDAIDGPYWEAYLPYGSQVDTRSGPTPLIAAMRCFVASRLGDEVEIPEELV